MSGPIAVLKLPKNRASLLVAFAKGILDAMQENPSFPAPDPPLATVQAAVDALEAATVAVHSRAVGTVAERNASRQKLVGLLQHLLSHVQKVADQSPEEAAAIIQSAGLHVKRRRVLPRRVFAAKDGPVSGTVKLVAPQAGNRVGYEWAYSVDGKKTWITEPITVKAATLVRGLAVGVTTYFRYRATTKDGKGDWSDPVALTVI